MELAGLDPSQKRERNLLLVERQAILMAGPSLAGRGRTGKYLGSGLSHDDEVMQHEPPWGEIDQDALPRVAFAEKGAANDPSTWQFAHHHVVGGRIDSTTGRYSSGTLYLHRGGLDAAWSDAAGLRSGAGGQPQARQEVLDHLREHRRALGLESANTEPASRSRRAPTQAEAEADWAIAIHESSHCAACYVYGGAIDFATIDPIGGDGGRVEYWNGAMHPMQAGEVAYAGWIGVKLFVNPRDPYPMNEKDWALVEQALSHYPASERSSRATSCQGFVGELLKRLEGRLGIGHISELAREFLSRRRMSGREIVSWYLARGLRPEV